MGQFPEISFIVVNYNGISDTRELLVSMRHCLALISYEVIIVDNGSEHNEAALLSKDFPEYTIIRSERNLGFSGGNNLGIKTSLGKYIMLLNNDTLLIDDSISNLVGLLNDNPLIGAVSPKIYFFDPPHTIQYAGFTEFSKISMRNRAIGYSEIDTGQYDIPSRTASAHGAAMMIKRDVIEKVGLMPEIFFLYYEEFDWCSQIMRCGFEIWYQPLALVIHKEGRSVGQKSYIKFYYLTRNRLLFALRNMKGLDKILAILYQLTIATPKGIFCSVFSGKIELAKAYFLGTLDLFFLKNKYL